MPIRLVIADDHGLLRAGLVALLNAENGMTVVGEADDEHSAVSQTVEKRPDVVLMDISMPDSGGIEATRRIKQNQPQTQVILLSAQLDGDVQEQGEGIGVYCYLAKGCSDNLIADMVTRAINLKNEFAG